MKVLRRLDDAVCAFATGHSRRDLDRVRRRRLILLAERLVRRRRRRLAEREERYRRWPDLRGQDEHLAAFREEMQTALDLSKRLIERTDRIVRAILIDELLIDRWHFDSYKMGSKAEIGTAYSPPSGFLDEVRSELGARRYGQIYEGLLEYRRLHALQHKLRLCVGHFGSFVARSVGTIASLYVIDISRQLAREQRDQTELARCRGSPG